MFNSLSALVVSFHSHIEAIQLANIIYPLVAGALMLSGGFLGLKIGWKKLLCCGVLILIVGETAAVFSMNVLFFTWVARVLAGMGASLAIPAAIGLIPETYQGKDVAIGFGAIGAAVGIASILGPIGGGWIIDGFGWRAAFSVLAISAAIIFFSGLAIDSKMLSNAKVKFDFVGTVLFAPSMILITMALIKIGAWSTIVTLACAVTGIILLALFLHYEFKLEKKQSVVLFPSEFLKSKQARDGLVMTGLIFFISGGLAFAVTTYLQVVLGYSALITGIVLAVNALGIIIFSIGTPLMIKNINAKLTCRISILLAVIAGLVIAVGIDPATLNVLFFIGIFVAGVAIGLLSSQAGVIVTTGITKAHAAQSGGIQGAMRNIGQAVGIALMGIIVIYALTASVKNHVLKSAGIQVNIKHEIQIQKSIPFLSNKQVMHVLKKAHVSQSLKKELLQINNIGRLHALRVTFLSFSVLSLLFMFFTFNIPGAVVREVSGKQGGDDHEKIK